MAELLSLGAVFIVLLFVVCIITLIVLVEHMRQEDASHTQQKHLLKEHLEMQEDFIDAYKDMLNAARRADMQSKQTWNNWHR